MSRLIVEFDESPHAGGEVHAKGLMRLGAALEGPPGRLHGGHHAFVRTLPIVQRMTAHEHARTFPCAVDVSMQRGLELEEAIPFEATYRSEGQGWALSTRFKGTDRLVAHAESIPDEPLLDAAELEHWRALYQASSPSDNSFEMFGFPIFLAEKLVWLESRDPLRTLPDSQHAALVEPDGNLGPVFVSTQLDAVGATARGALMRHPHFTKHIEIRFATDRIPAETHLLCLADRTRIREDDESSTAPVEIKGQAYGTADVPVALVDAAFERVYATGTITVHPVDPSKFEQLQRMREIRQDR
ncbi:MAG: hypothetical protein ACN4G0_00895 [Polyangiales bacterium]